MVNKTASCAPGVVYAPRKKGQAIFQSLLFLLLTPFQKRENGSRSFLSVLIPYKAGAIRTVLLFLVSWVQYTVLTKMRLSHIRSFVLSCKISSSKSEHVRLWRPFGSDCPYCRKMPGFSNATGNCFTPAYKHANKSSSPTSNHVRDRSSSASFMHVHEQASPGS